MQFILPFQHNLEPRHKFYLWWTQKTWTVDTIRMEIRSRERTPPGCHFRRSKKGALYGEEHTKGRRLKVPGPEQCDGIGSKMLSAWASLDPVFSKQMRVGCIRSHTDMSCVQKAVCPRNRGGERFDTANSSTIAVLHRKTKRTHTELWVKENPSLNTDLCLIQASYKL